MTTTLSEDLSKVEDCSLVIGHYTGHTDTDESCRLFPSGTSQVQVLGIPQEVVFRLVGVLGSHCPGSEYCPYLGMLEFVLSHCGNLRNQYNPSLELAIDISRRGGIGVNVRSISLAPASRSCYQVWHIRALDCWCLRPREHGEVGAQSVPK